MKFLRLLFIIIIIIVGLGIGIYYYGTSFVAGKVTEVVNKQLENEETLANIKAAVNNNPEIKQFIDDGASVNDDDLPFTTKEEAIETIIKKIGINELNDLKHKYEAGITVTEAQQLVEQLEPKLTEDEILALKSIAYKELYK